MAEQNCPNCKENTFTWHNDDEESPFTIWSCRNCGYRAFENESTIRNCPNCNKGTDSILNDNIKTYWWCSNCDRTEIISN